MRKAASLILIMILVFQLVSCGSADEQQLELSIYNVYAETSFDYFEEGYQCSIINVMYEDGYYYVVTESLPLDFDDDQLYNHSNIHKVTDSGELVQSYQLGEINPYISSDIKNGILIYGTLDGKVVKFDLSTGTFVDSKQMSGGINGVSFCDDGYVVISIGHINKYDNDNNLISTINNNEWGMFTQTGSFYEEAGKEYIVSGYGSDMRYYQLDFDNSTSEFLFATQGLENRVTNTFCQYIFDGDGESRINFESGEIVPLLKWNEINIQPAKSGLGNDEFHVVFDDDTLCRIYNYADGMAQMLVYKFEGTEQKHIEEITIGGYDIYQDLAIRWAIYKFNSSQDEYRAAIQDYHDLFGDSDSATVTNASLIQYFSEGNGPDIYYGNWFDYESLFRNGMTQDILPHIPNDARERLNAITPNIRELMMNSEGELYRVFSSYQLDGYVGSEDMLDGNTNLSISELLELANSKSASPIQMNVSSELAYTAISYYVRQNGMCSEEDIKEVLEFAYEYGYQDYTSYGWQAMSESTLTQTLLWRYGVYSPAVLSETERDCKSRLIFEGVPAIDGAVHMIIPDGQVGLSSATNYPEQCCELISFLLDEDVQMMYFTDCKIPVNQDAVDMVCEACIDHTSTENMSIRNYLGYFDDITEDEADRFLQAVYSADAVMAYDWGMREIVTQEVNSYYLEGRSVDDIALSLTNRLSLYMSENYG